MGDMEDDEFDVEEDMNKHMGENMIGETVDISATKGAGDVRKKLITPGLGYDNPMAPYDVAIKYTGRVAGAEAPFDTKHAEEPLCFEMPRDDEPAPVPAGVCRAIRTMLKGEKVLVTLTPAVAFGAEGDATLGVPPDATVEYELELVEYWKVEKSQDGLVRIKTVMDARTWEIFEDGSEVFFAYEAKLADGTVVASSDGSVSSTPYVVGRDEENAKAGFPPFLKSVTKQVHLLSKYELTVAPEAAYGVDGDPALGVPPGATIMCTLEAKHNYTIEDASGGEGTLIKKTVTKGNGWAKPHVGWQALVHYSARAAEAGSAELDASRPSADAADAPPIAFVVGSEADAGLPPVFGNVAGMIRGEVAEFTCTAGSQWAVRPDGSVLGGGGSLVYKLELVGWVEIKPVPKTDGAVRMKLVHAGDGSYERPTDGTTVRTHITVSRAPVGAGEGAAPLEDTWRSGAADQEPASWVVDDDTMLPAVDAAVREMAKGAIVELDVPAGEWGYNPAVAKARGIDTSAIGQPLHVRLELLSFEKAKDTWDLEPAERAELQLRKKEQGNALFSQGLYARALLKYDKSISAVQDATDQFEEGEQRAAVDKVHLQCVLNQAACHLRVGNHKGAVDAANKALSMDAESIKGLLRRGQGYARLGETAPAKEDLMKVIKLDPKNRDAREELKALKERLADEKRKEKAIFGHMFDRISLTRADESGAVLHENGHAADAPTVAEGN